MLFLIIVWFFLIKNFQVQCEVINDPTLKAGNSNLEEDVKNIGDQCGKDFSFMDREKICSIVFHRTYKERLELRDSFDSQYTVTFGAWFLAEQMKGLTDVLSRISDNSLDKLYDIAFIPFEEILAGVVRDTLTGDDDHSPAVEEVMCAEDNDMKKRIQESYQKKFNVALEQDFVQYKKDDVAYHEAMTKYCLPARAPELKITEQIATDAANALRQVENDKEAFKTKLKEILDQKHSEADLKLIFQKYRKDDNGIDTTIDNVFEGDEKLPYKTLVKYIESTCKYYADALHESMDGFGTDINRISRIVMTRCERDLACIHKEYKSIHGETYTERLSDDTSERRYLEAIRYLSGKPK